MGRCETGAASEKVARHGTATQDGREEAICPEPCGGFGRQKEVTCAASCEGTSDATTGCRPPEEGTEGTSEEPTEENAREALQTPQGLCKQ